MRFYPLFRNCLLALGFAALLFSTGCATVIKGGSTTVRFNSEPPGADVILDGETIGQTPMVKDVEHGEHSVLFRKEGFEDIPAYLTSSFSGWSLLLFPWSTLVDAIAGNLSTLDQSKVAVQLIPAGDAGSGARAAKPPTTNQPAADWPDLREPPEEVGGGEQDAALIVGIEKYLLVSPVPGAVDNAQDWFLWLTKTRKVPLKNIKFLRNEEATDAAMLEAAKQVAKRAGKKGKVWFVFIGHGAPSKDQKDGLLVGADAQQSAIGLYARSVPQKKILAALNQGRQRQTIMVIDACFSGKSNNGDALVSGLQPLIPVEIKPSKATILSAGKSNEFAGPLPKGNRPAFSYLVLGALRGWGDADEDGNVTAEEAVQYARESLQGLLTDRQQTPELNGPGGKEVLSTEVEEEGPDLGDILLQ